MMIQRLIVALTLVSCTANSMNKLVPVRALQKAQGALSHHTSSSLRTIAASQVTMRHFATKQDDSSWSDTTQESLNKLHTKLRAAWDDDTSPMIIPKATLMTTGMACVAVPAYLGLLYIGCSAIGHPVDFSELISSPSIQAGSLFAVKAISTSGAVIGTGMYVSDNIDNVKNIISKK